MTDQPCRAEPSPEARELLAHHDRLDLAEMLAAVHRLGEQQRAKVACVTGLYERWVKAGPPPLGTSMARWWDAQLVELHNAIRPPADTPTAPLAACRRMETRTCPASYAGPCGERPCARFESDDATPWLGPVAEAVRQMDADTTQPHTGLVVQPYREHGEEKWVFRCWGTSTCDGVLSLDHTSEQSATRARDRHVTEEHPEEAMPTPDICTATIDGPNVLGGGPVQCTREAGHPENHVGPKRGDAGRTLWTDYNAGATPHGASSEEQR